jgi:uncharacterized membrane protein YdjX (TVP38/TMEM64 family)
MGIMPEIFNARTKQPAWIRDMIFAVLALLFLIGLTWLSGWGASRHARDVERLFAAWRGDGLAGPMWCIVLQALQVVFFFVPGEILSFAAGYIFGTWHGLAYSFAGIMAGSAFNFYLARVVGRPALARIIKPSSLDRVDRLFAGTNGKFAIFTLFLIPVGPKDALCYGAAFSGMSLPEFAAISGVARIPGLLFNTYLGADFSHFTSAFFVLTGLVALAIFVCLHLYRRYKANNAACMVTENNSCSEAATMLSNGPAKLRLPFVGCFQVRRSGKPSTSP